MDERGTTCDGACDVRDLGGLPTHDGRRTSSGASFRSSSPRSTTSEGSDQARDAGAYLREGGMAAADIGTLRRRLLG